MQLTLHRVEASSDRECQTCATRGHAAIGDLAEIITEEKPFGPLASEDVGDELFEHIFDHSISAYRRLKQQPSLIIGRRGSGKTALLSGLRFERKYALTVVIPPDKAFSHVIDAIDARVTQGMIVETAASLWVTAIWTYVFCRAVDAFQLKYPREIELILLYLHKIGVKHGFSITKIISLIIKIIARTSKNEDTYLDIIGSVEEIVGSSGEFGNAVRAFSDIMRAEKSKAAILIDNIEQIDMSRPSVSLAMSSLLKALTHFRSPDIPCDVKCCIPSEVYLHLIKISSNPEKDFASTILLHWNSSELLHMASIRYLVFLKHFGDLAKRSKFGKTARGRELRPFEFFAEMAPDTIRNRRGVEEHTLRYLLRHTQMLPRQLIAYLNAIANRAVVLGGSNFWFPEASIIEGIRSIEHRIVGGIFSGFKTVYPDVEHICEAMLPNMRSVFRLGDLQKVFRIQKGRLETCESHNDVLRVLVDIGAVGVFVQEGPVYIEAQYSYNLPGKLIYGLDDKFCVHPLFHRTYSVGDPEQGYKPIFPRGAEVGVET